MKAIAKKITGRVFAEGLTNRAPDPCELCFGNKVQVLPAGARPCPNCVRPEDRIAIMRERVPKRYQGITLEHLEPRVDLHPQQAKHIKLLQDHPERNYYICGRNDTGKTHLLYALYDHALVSGRNVMIGTLFEMIESVKSGFGEHPENRKIHGIRMADLDQTRYKYGIFIDDADKARPTEFVAEFFFDFVDRIYKNQHQLVVTSQLDPEGLADHFERAHSRYGVGIARRIINEETGVIRMF